MISIRTQCQPMPPRPATAARPRRPSTDEMLAFIQHHFPQRSLSLKDIRAMMRIGASTKDISRAFLIPEHEIWNTLAQGDHGWLLVHGPVLFEGTLIMWEDRA